MSPKHLKDRVDWPTLKAWCFAHGAKNEHITSIRIDGQAPNEFSLILEGNEIDTRKGGPFLEARREVARWRSVQPLRFLP